MKTTIQWSLDKNFTVLNFADDLNLQVLGLKSHGIKSFDRFS